jgi:hypothetical protein
MIAVMPLLIWAVPVCFALHVVEEFFLPGGFMPWYHQFRPWRAQATPRYYLKVNGIVLLIAIVVAATAGTDGTGNEGVLIVTGALTSNVLLTHVWGALATRRYSPGMVTGLALILPLTIGVWALTIGVGRTEPIAFLVAAVVSPLKEIHAARPPAKDRS